MAYILSPSTIHADADARLLSTVPTICIVVLLVVIAAAVRRNSV